MREKFLFYDTVYGAITTKNEQYLKERKQFRKANNRQVFLSTTAIIFYAMSILSLVLGLTSDTFHSYQVVGLVLLGVGLVCALGAIFNSCYIESKDYIKHFKETKEYKEQIKKK